MRTPHLLSGLGLLALAVFLLFWKLGVTSFHNEDEALYAQCAREMTEGGDYLTAHYGGQPFLEKPPGKIWFIVAGFRLLGTTEWGARLSSAVFSLGTIGLTVLLGRALLGLGAGLLAGTILVSSVQFLHEHCARTAEYEPETVFFFTLAMYCLYRTGLNRRWAPGVGIALGFLALVKGPVVAPALLVVVLYVLARRPRPSLGLRWPLLGAAAFLAIALPWHVYQFATNGELFRRMYWEAQILGRLTGRLPLDLVPMVPGVEDAARPLYYPHVLLVSMFPWTLIFFPALAFAARGILERSRGARRHSLAALLLPLLWIHAYVAAIFIAEAKFTWYAIPLLPALALVLVWSVQRLWSLDSRPLFYGAGSLLLISSLAMAPSPEYDPCSRISALWPFDEPNLVPLTRLTGSDLLSWLPLGVTAALLVGVATVWFVARARGRRLEGRRVFGLLVLGSFLFSGLCQVALPLRGADYRSDFARCRDAVRTQGVAANRALLLDEKTAERTVHYTEYFYVYEMSGGANGAIVGTRLRPDRLADPRVLQRGTLLLGLPRWAPLLDRTDGVERLWLGETVVAGYVP